MACKFTENDLFYSILNFDVKPLSISLTNVKSIVLNFFYFTKKHLRKSQIFKNCERQWFLTVGNTNIIFDLFFKKNEFATFIKLRQKL